MESLTRVESVFVIMLLIGYIILVWVLYHSLFDVVYFNLFYGIIKEIFVVIICGGLLFGASLKYWKVTMGILIVCLLGAQFSNLEDSEKKGIQVLCVLCLIGTFLLRNKI